MKRTADYYLAGAFGLLVMCSAITAWLYLRYQQAAAAFDEAFKTPLRSINGKLVVSGVQEQALATTRLHWFLAGAAVTVLCGIGLVIIVLWHRKQRLLEAEPEAADELAKA